MAATYLLSLYPACLGAVTMTSTTVVALLAHVKVRYSITDNDGNKLLDFPYNPAQKIIGREKEVAKAVRTHRAYENSKEWTALTMPVMFAMSLYGGYLPYVSDRTNRWMVGLTSMTWCVGNVLYCNGYAKSNAERMIGFKIRTFAFKVFLCGSLASLSSYGYKKLTE